MRITCSNDRIFLYWSLNWKYDCGYVFLLVVYRVYLHRIVVYSLFSIEGMYTIGYKYFGTSTLFSIVKVSYLPFQNIWKD